MGKSILVMDTPKYCISCPCHFCEMNGRVWCGKENKTLYADDIETFKPDWCPLQDAPDYKEVSDDPYSVGNPYDYGWNACLTQILNGG